MNTGLFRKEAMSRFLRADAPGALVTIAPPSMLLAFGVLAVLTVALAALTFFSQVTVVAEGRGVVQPDEPYVVLRAPFAGTVLKLGMAAGADGSSGAMLLSLDARKESLAHDQCSAQLTVEQADLAALEQRLGAWNDAPGRDREAAMALVLLAQIRAQRDKVNDLTQRCDALGTTVERGRVTLPVDGRVTEVTVLAGSQVHEGDILATIVPASAHLVGYLDVPEPDRADLAIGQKVRLAFDALPSEDVGVGEASVARLLDTEPPSVTAQNPPASGTVHVEIAIERMPGTFGAPRAGMTFTGDVMTRRARLLSILFGGQ